ncbi:MAG TPA: FtsX-like permease family protein, partial [Gemmatimonadaceae bacterium]
TYYDAAVRTSGLYERLAQRIEALPGVTRAAFTTHLPLVSGDWCSGVTLEGPTPEAVRGTCPTIAIVSPGYFEVMGAQVEGRTLDWISMNASDGALLVSRSFANHHWPNERAIDKGIRAGIPNVTTYYRVAGVVDDVRSNGLDAPPTEIVYFPVRPLAASRLWDTPRSGYLVVKTSVSNPLTLTNAITREVQELEPAAAVANVTSMETIVARSIARRSFTMVLLGIAAAMALLLSAVGIYGVVSYVVAQRRAEIGVRMALGADRRDVTRMVLSQSLGLTLIGVVAGLAAALATTRVLRVLLYGVAPNDPVTLVMVPVLLVGVALVASYLPARRAARTDPVVALRSD